jgi:hypothetical protein
MRPDPNRPRKRAIGLEVRAFYSVGELARAANVPAYRLLRILRRNGVAFLRVGRLYYVTLTEVRRKIPPLWESLCMTEELRRGAGKATSTHASPRTVLSSAASSASPRTGL